MRTSYFASGVFSLVVLLMISVSPLSLFAAPQSQPSATPPPAAGTQGATSPTSPSQASPSPAAPQTGTSPGTPGAAQPPAQAADDNPLNLTEEQKAKLRPILMEERQQMEALSNDTSMTTEQKIAKAQKIRETASPKIKAVLTPEQLQKLSDMQKKQQQNQGAPAASTPPPQR